MVSRPVARLRLARAVRIIAVVTGVCVAASCDLGKTAIPRADPILVVHAILDPTANRQIVIVQQSLTGSVTISPSATGGVPVSGATVKLTDPDGRELFGQEIFDGQTSTSTGQYFLFLTPRQLQRGKRYTLSVAALGQTVNGSTVIPDVTPAFDGAFQGFNRDHDSVTPRFPPGAAARAYWVRIDAPVAPYQIFSVDKPFSISGLARNFATSDLVHVFYPGFLQTVTFAAVDTNVYDYYRSGNDPFSGTGLITHLSGGLGVFGSVVPFDERELDVTQDPTGDPIEGRFTLRGNSSAALRATDITLYLAASGNGQPDQISGLYSYTVAGTSNTFSGGILGTRNSGFITLDLFAARSPAAPSVLTFFATQHGDTLIGGYNKGESNVVFVRVGK